MLATLTGTLAASRLGIAGTIIGAAFMSLASTVGAAVYNHYITSSKARLQAAAASIAPLATHTAVASAVARHHPEEQTQADRTRVDRTRLDHTRLDRPGGQRYVSPDAAETQIIPPLHENGNLASARTQTDLGRLRDPAETAREVAAAGPGAGSAGGSGSGGGGPAGPAGRRWPWSGLAWSRRRWLMAGAAALGVFVLAMAVVTIIEVAAGKPLDAVVWHQKGSGTTVGRLVGSGGGGHHPQPSTSPSPGRSRGRSHSPSQSPSSSPTPTTTSPTPTPSGSPTPSSSATPTGGASTPAGTNSPPPAQGATPTP